MKVLASLVDGDETDARSRICGEGDLKLCRPFCPVKLQRLDLENGLCTKVLAFLSAFENSQSLCKGDRLTGKNVSASLYCNHSNDNESPSTSNDLLASMVMVSPCLTVIDRGCCESSPLTTTEGGWLGRVFGLSKVHLTMITEGPYQNPMTAFSCSPRLRLHSLHPGREIVLDLGPPPPDTGMRRRTLLAIHGTDHFVIGVVVMPRAGIEEFLVSPTPAAPVDPFGHVQAILRDQQVQAVILASALPTTSLDHRDD
jgi:hypothetical protein